MNPQPHPRAPRPTWLALLALLALLLVSCRSCPERYPPPPQTTYEATAPARR